MGPAIVLAYLKPGKAVSNLSPDPCIPELAATIS
jgi:hypothetical protein